MSRWCLKSSVMGVPTGTAWCSDIAGKPGGGTRAACCWGVPIGMPSPPSERPGGVVGMSPAEAADAFAPLAGGAALRAANCAEVATAAAAAAAAATARCCCCGDIAADVGCTR